MSTTTATYKTIKVIARYTGAKPSKWSKENWNHHKITVRNTETGKFTSFDFWASIMEPEIRKPSDALGALCCFLDDAVSGAESFEEFCGNFGYDTDSRQAHATWKACRRSYECAIRLLGDESALYRFADEIREKHG